MTILWGLWCVFRWVGWAHDHPLGLQWVSNGKIRLFSNPFRRLWDGVSVMWQYGYLSTHGDPRSGREAHVGWVMGPPKAPKAPPSPRMPPANR